MTAVASSVTPIFPGDLTLEMLRLLEKDFWHIVGLRLNLPSQEQQNQIFDANEHIGYLTEECLIDELFVQLAQTKQTIITKHNNNNNNDKSVAVRKYYH
jgi:hypothetical protein